MTKKYLDEQGLVKVAEAINAKQDELVSGTSIKTVAGQSLLGAGDVAINTSPMIETIYADLKALRDNSQLVPGMQYRITDYVTKVSSIVPTGETSLSSLEKPFDLIVTANSTNSFDCHARAMRHAGDTYFQYEDIEKWQIWYQFNGDDQTLYNWCASGNSGKGVIYRMIDEVGNDCPYDFKNIILNGKMTFYNRSNTTTDMSMRANIDYDAKRCCGNVIKPARRPPSGYTSRDSNWSFALNFITLPEYSRDNIFEDNCYHIDSTAAIYRSHILAQSHHFALNGCSDSIIYGDNLTFNGGVNNSVLLRVVNSTFANMSMCNMYNCTNLTFNGYVYGCQFLHNDNIILPEYTRDCTFDSFVKYVTITAPAKISTSDYLQNIHVHAGVAGTSANVITINCNRSLAYSTDVYASGSQTIIL